MEQDGSRATFTSVAWKKAQLIYFAVQCFVSHAYPTVRVRGQNLPNWPANMTRTKPTMLEALSFVIEVTELSHDSICFIDNLTSL